MLKELDICFEDLNKLRDKRLSSKHIFFITTELLQNKNVGPELFVATVSNT